MTENRRLLSQPQLQYVFSVTSITMHDIFSLSHTHTIMITSWQVLENLESNFLDFLCFDHCSLFARSKKKKKT